MIIDRKKIKIYITYTVVVILAIIFFTFFSTRTVPHGFPVGTTFVVKEGENLNSVSLRLENENYIYSALLFRTWISFLGRDRYVQLGVYTFDKPLVLGAVIKKLVSGNPDPLISITIPEGSTSYEVAQIVKKELPTLSVDIFGEKVSAMNADGKLFPSTYYLLPSVTEEKIVNMMVKTFESKYNVSFQNIHFPAELRTQEEVISLAAILEGEAKTVDDMKIVAGILLKRLSMNMLLQVDVAKETYKTKGLPIQPINNPGLKALDAAFNPIKTDYLYYITGKDGTMHYAKTFEEHKRNIQKYLK